MSSFIFNMELHCTDLELLRRTVFLTIAVCVTENKRPSAVSYFFHFHVTFYNAHTHTYVIPMVWSVLAIIVLYQNHSIYLLSVFLGQGNISVSGPIPDQLKSEFKQWYPPLPSLFKENLKHAAKLKEFYSECLYNHHRFLYVINIFMLTCFITSIIY